MKINDKIKKQLKNVKVNSSNAIQYLLCIHFGLETTLIPNDVIRKVNTLAIFERDFNSTSLNKVKWLIPLFAQVEDLQWISEWMDMFKHINRDRRGSKQACIDRMIKWLNEHPDVTVDRIFHATRRYLRSLNDPKFCKKSEKFIYEGIGVLRNSLLEEWVNRTKEEELEHGENNRLQMDNEDW